MIRKFSRFTFDRRKRDFTFSERALAFEEAAIVFDGPTFTLLDDRFDYGEVRYQTYGILAARVVVVVWTERDDAAHIISMRHCHDKETRKFKPRLG